MQIKFAVSYLYAWMLGKMNGEVWREMYIFGITEYPGYFDIYPEDVLIKKSADLCSFCGCLVSGSIFMLNNGRQEVLMGQLGVEKIYIDEMSGKSKSTFYRRVGKQ